MNWPAKKTKKASHKPQAASRDAHLHTTRTHLATRSRKIRKLVFRNIIEIGKYLRKFPPSPFRELSGFLLLLSSYHRDN